MINSIDSSVLQQAGAYVDECDSYAEIHTVTMTLNGRHGKVDLKIEGTSRANDDDYEREYIVGY